MNMPIIHTINKLRNVFWNERLDLHYVPGQRQNDYPPEVRKQWVFFVDSMRRQGSINNKLAEMATL